ncbi:MAG: binding-protein-dependent transport system inner rane component [Nocardioidaceae bacterium]|jgi:multiple sugar transport system permease protein|nr:binding-protein-dependent transport system inner rane component [Nocardioidaceae bacterium]
MERRNTALWWIGGAVIFVYCLVPVVWIVMLSFKTPAALSDKRFIPETFSTQNYDFIINGAGSDLFLPALRNSFGICLIATFIAVILSMFCAYAIARLEFPGKRIILTSALAVAIFPVISIVTPLFNLWREIGLYDTWPGLIIPYLSLTLPLSIWVLSAFFREIPWEMEQAAQVDGATAWQAFRKVIVPLAAPGVFTTAIIAFFIAWNDFVYGISLSSTEASRPVPAALAFFTGASQFEQPTGAIAAAAVVVTIPVVILVLLFQRRIVAGLTNGAVKG